MKLYTHFFLFIAFIFLASCTSDNSLKSESNNNQINPSQKVVTLDKNFKAAIGQTIYVPIYSYINHSDQKEPLNLAATLSIRNTDLNRPMIITSVRYYDSSGKLVNQYLKQAIQLEPLASTDFFVQRSDISGGLGANFIVEWVAQTEISEPIVEAIMIATEFQQGVSFVSRGKVIKTQKNNNSSPTKPSS